MGVRSIMRVLIRDVFRAPACHLRSPLQLIIRRIRRTGILIGSSRRGHGPSCVRVLRHAMRRAVCRAAVALARELSPILSQRLQTGLLFLPLIQMPHPVGPLLTLVLTVCLLRFAAKRIGSPSPVVAFRFIDSTPGGLEARVAHTG